MIFRPELIRQITAGKKTQTRRVIKPYDPPPGAPRRQAPRTIDLDGRRVLYRYAPGDTHAVQPGRGKRAETRIHILAVRHEHAGDITYTDARAEGFRTTDDFKAYWVRLHDHAWVAGSEYPDHDEYLTDEQLVDRFDQAHAHTPVWAITFELDREHQPRLLAPCALPAQAGDARGTDDELGYTSSPSRALIDAGEAIDAQLLAIYTEDAHERFAGDPGRRIELAKRRAASLAKRLRQATATAANGDLAIDLHAQLDQIEQHIALLDQRQAA